MLHKFIWSAFGAKVNMRLLSPDAEDMSLGVCGPKPLQSSSPAAVAVTTKIVVKAIDGSPAM
jgi:hypothetical protein